MSERGGSGNSGSEYRSSYWKNSSSGRSLPGSAVSLGSTSPVTQQPTAFTNSPHSSQATRMPMSPKRKQPTSPFSTATMGSSGKSSFKDYEATTLDAWEEGDDETMVIPKLSDTILLQRGPFLGSPGGEGEERVRDVNIDPRMVSDTAQKVLDKHISTSSISSRTVHSKDTKETEKDTRKDGGRSLGSQPQSHQPNRSSSTHSTTSSATRASRSYPPSSAAAGMPDSREQIKTEKLESLISASSTNMEELRQLSWSGIPKKLRPTIWKILSGYLPSSMDRRSLTLTRKREEYFGFVSKYYDTRHEETYESTFRQIHIDVPRMNPLIPLFQNTVIQEIFERILYIWAMRHPASGYVQGINDLVTPFFIVFLSEHLNTDCEIRLINIDGVQEERLDEVEADTFWCTSRLLEGIQDNYTFAQPGIQKKVTSLKSLMLRIDGSLCQHLEAHQIDFLQFSFRWMNNLLMREIPLRCSIRLWDTYQAEPEGFSQFHLYVCAAFLKHFSSRLTGETDFQGLMTALQNLPTSQWGEEQIGEVLAEAFKLKYMFADSPQHTR